LTCQAKLKHFNAAGDQCYNFVNIFANNLAMSTRNTAICAEKNNHNIGFQENCQFFAEN
jgi:hypothetical protein